MIQLLSSSVLILAQTALFCEYYHRLFGYWMDIVYFVLKALLCVSQFVRIPHCSGLLYLSLWSVYCISIILSDEVNVYNKLSITVSHQCILKGITQQLKHFLAMKIRNFKKYFAQIKELYPDQNFSALKTVKPEVIIYFFRKQLCCTRFYDDLSTFFVMAWSTKRVPAVKMASVSDRGLNHCSSFPTPPLFANPSHRNDPE